MTHIPSVYVTWLAHHNLYQPRCSCGWYSQQTKSREAAQQVADAHADFANKRADS